MSNLDLTSPSLLYYNILIKNNNTGFDNNGNSIPITNSVPLVFDEARSNYYINDPCDYYMSVVSFQVDSQSLPIFICEPVVGSNNINDTIYWLTITDSSDNVLSHQNVQWEPEDLSAVPPVGTAPANYTANPYYYSYSYNHFVGLINKTIENMCNSISFPDRAPFMTVKDGTVSITGSLSGFATAYQFDLPTYKLFFNTELFYLFSSLNSLARGDPLTGSLGGITYNANYQILFVQNPSGLNYSLVYVNLNEFPLTTSYPAIVNTCDYPPFAFWNPIDSIVFKVAQLHVVPELISANSQFGTEGGVAPTNADQYNILSDYVASFVGTDTYQPAITYEPVAEYRLSDLYGKGKISQLQITTSWKDKNGIQHVFNLESGGTAAIKIMFRKKEFN